MAVTFKVSNYFYLLALMISYFSYSFSPLMYSQASGHFVCWGVTDSVSWCTLEGGTTVFHASDSFW